MVSRGHQPAGHIQRSAGGQFGGLPVTPPPATADLASAAAKLTSLRVAIPAGFTRTTTQELPASPDGGKGYWSIAGQGWGAVAAGWARFRMLSGAGPGDGGGYC
jgi:hypothetical protein